MFSVASHGDVRVKGYFVDVVSFDVALIRARDGYHPPSEGHCSFFTSRALRCPEDYPLSLRSPALCGHNECVSGFLCTFSDED